MIEERLKVQALTESIGQLTQKYEVRIAELRVEITLLQQENKKLSEKLSEPAQMDIDGEVLEGELVQEED